MRAAMLDNPLGAVYHSRMRTGQSRPILPSVLPSAPAGVAAPSPGRVRDERGFTLLELLVVIAILGLLVALVAPAALRQLGSARVSVARQSVARIGSILDLYKLDVGSYPSSEDGLKALVDKPGDADGWNGPYVKDGHVPLDPWNHAYLYANPSSRANHEYDLCSGGPQNLQGTPGQDGMICNP